MLLVAKRLHLLTGRNEKFPILLSNVEALVPGAESRRHLRLCYFVVHGCYVR